VETPVFDADGFDADAHAIIADRRERLYMFIQAHCTLDRPVPPLTPEHDAALRAAVAPVISTLDDVAYRELAQMLGLFDVALGITLRAYWRVGVFMSMHPRDAVRTGIKPTSPSIEEVTQRVRAVMTTSPHMTHWERAFKNDRLCRDDDGAKQLAHDLTHIPNTAIRMARGLLQKWVQIGSLALLEYAHYPYLGVLQRLHRREAQIAEATQEPQLVIAMLRADLVALQRTLSQKSLQKRARKLSQSPIVLWDESVLHQPAHSRQRELYQRRVAIPALRGAILQELAQQRGCDATYATDLFSRFASGGLDILMAWHCGAGIQAIRQRYDAQLIRSALEPHVRAFPADARRRIVTRLEHLQAANVATDRCYPVYTLIRDLPSSPDRRQQRKRRLSTEFVDLFAESEGITSTQARNLLSLFRTYGCLGLLPKREWPTLFHPRIWSYLHLFKLGRIEETIRTWQLTERVNIYAQVLGLEALTTQVILAIFNHFRKLRYWHSGEGSAMYQMKRRGSLNIEGILRLHEQWLVCCIELPIELVNSNMRPLKQPCFAVLVVDCGCERPLSCLLFTETPGSLEVGLALYCAIWHPDALDWPLRGIPETILLPRALATVGLADLQHAATWLMAQVEIIDNTDKLLGKLPYAEQLIKDLQKIDASALSNGRSTTVPPTLIQAQQSIVGWLRKRCFPGHHIDPAPRELRKHGVVMPGYDTPAAGWLLPVKQQVPTIRDGVEIGRRVYAHPLSGVQHGGVADVRINPYPYGKTPRAVFIEERDTRLLHYLELQPQQ